MPQRIERWRAHLSVGSGLKVGLVWKGFAENQHDATRSVPGLAPLAPLWTVPGVTFFSLQKGQGETDATAPPANQPIVHLGSAIEDFADTAAIITQLDLLITVDTAAAHIAGALSKPCWLMLPHDWTDWRWLLERDDSPWYPGVMRLFRQSDARDWGKWPNASRMRCGKGGNDSAGKRRVTRAPACPRCIARCFRPPCAPDQSMPPSRHPLHIAHCRAATER
ncbi:hypothetical protein [Paraburkholderia terrae]